MSDSSKAIFLSYAREDAAGARRIAEALRTQGIEVWFDENELRGGDSWDAKIKKQIRECALFMPVISANTQARGEGYFRREWRLGVERTHDMAEGVPFLVPVAIDETAESSALVPEQFMRSHWSRLRGGLPTAEFVGQIKALLDGPKGVPTGGQRTEHGGRKAEDRGQRSEGGATPRKSWLMPVIVGVVVAVGLAVFMLRKPAAAPAPAATAAPIAAETKVAAMTTDKSLAVLPFTNMSEDKEANAFFADGIHEDILTNLALIRELRVVSRTSVLSYRNTTKSMKQIAQELGVTYILEGSVRRVGNKVRVTGQLIHAATDEHVWAQAYDRDLTDIFAIQAELSQQIAGALKAALSPEEKIFIARTPTTNPAAYDAYLQGRDTRNRAPTASRPALEKAEELFSRAVELDPNFAAAWGELAVVHALKVFWDIDASAERQAKGDLAIARARQLAPDAPEVLRLVGTHAYYAYRDYATATAFYQRVISQQPNDPTSYGSLGLIQRRQGRWAEAIASLRRASELDPGNITYTRNLLSTYYYVRRWDEARVVQQRLLALLPGQLEEELAAAFNEWRATGSLAVLDATVARLTPARREEPLALFYRKEGAVARGDYAEFKKLQERQPIYRELEAPLLSMVDAAAMHWANGNRDAAQTLAAAIRSEATDLSTREPGNLRAQLTLGAAEGFLGHKDEATRLTLEVTTRLPISRDGVDGSSCQYWLVTIFALTGDKDRAIAELAKLLRVPSQFSIHTMRTDPALANLRGDPRFEALLNDPKNSAPLF